MQMIFSEVSQQASSQFCDQMFEVVDALRQHMLHWLGLLNIMQLAGTCRAWRQLILATPQEQLSEEARRAVLPSGLTSSRPLLQLIKQQAQLLCRLRGKHGFTPGIQRLSFRDELLYDSRQGNAQQTKSARMLQVQFQEIQWSPCARLEDGSRWLLLDPDRNRHCLLPIVIDTETGRQVCFQEDLTRPMELLSLCDIPPLNAAWLARGSDQILIFPSRGQMHASIACLANARSRSILPIALLGAALLWGFSEFFTACDLKGAERDILCLVQESDRELSYQISMFDAPTAQDFQCQISVFDALSRQLLYQLSCPKQLHEGLKNLQIDQRDNSRRRFGDGKPGSCKLLLSPNKQLLAVVWRQNLDYLVAPRRRHPVLCMGLGIHSAVTGDLEYSKPLTSDTSRLDRKCPLSWLPCSSNLVHASNGGLLHLMTSSGRTLWSSARADRNSAPITSRAGHDAGTKFSPSPCGRWILVMDDEAPGWSSYASDLTGHITVVEASTGRNLADHYSRRPLQHVKGTWSMSGDICLLEHIDCVLVYRSQAYPTLQTFQQYALVGRQPSRYRWVSSNYLSLSPCGRFIAELSNSASGLRYWHLPPSASSVQGGAPASACKTLQPSM